MGQALHGEDLLLEVLGADLAEGCVVLSGPSFAAELARRLPTAVTLASRSEDNAVAVQGLFQNDHFRLYTQSDVIGTELGGSLKNVIALAAGIANLPNLKLRGLMCLPAIRDGFASGRSLQSRTSSPRSQFMTLCERETGFSPYFGAT